jgi:hypothetical protein
MPDFAGEARSVGLELTANRFPTGPITFFWKKCEIGEWTIGDL